MMSILHDSIGDYLLQQNILSPDQLRVAQKLQQQSQGPLAMILLRLQFISTVQLGELLEKGFTLVS